MSPRYLAFSRKLASIPHLESFLGASVHLGAEAGAVDAVLGWGHKPTADKARRYAAEHGLPYIAAEDGFLRSLGLGCAGADPLSLVVDGSGIYYDATGPSDLETLLESSGWETPELLDSADRALGDIRRHCLSKYNHAPLARPDLLGDASRPRVLVIDQTYGDSSVGLGLASEQSFSRMLEAAKRQFPDGHIFVKTHPDVLAGKKKGYLTEAARLCGATLIAEDAAPLSLLEQADAVFCVTSQMGFEALMLGKPVFCFGMPFYAGWGLTQDDLTCARRTRRRSMREVFAAAYLLYARYVDPVSGERCDIHDVIRRLAVQREKNEQNRGMHACFGFSALWKHPHADAYLQGTASRRRFFQYFHGEQRAVACAARHNGDVVAWSSRCVDGRLEALCRNAGVPLIRMEDGFIRSVGLGSNFQWPYSLVLDRRGIYYDPSQPSDLEVILNGLASRPDHDELCRRACQLREFIVAKGLTKYNVGGGGPSRDRWPADRRILLVPGQVEDDASVRRGGCGIRNNFELLQAVRRYEPDAFIIYKPHPDVEVRNRKGRIPDEQALTMADEVVRDVRMDAMLAVVDEVHTLTSLTGFEALLRGIPVRTYGGPFYAGWGLTEDRAEERSFLARRNARLTLDELTAGTLLLYPSYYDWQTKNFCSAEDVCRRLLQPGGQMKDKTLTRLFAFLREAVRKFR
ncbi:MAG: capsular polysaccharide biosynthesis protein [Mailhella sp.]|nr:capsular polysaccharide biosynthesis protein [Mailhella sp.]